MPLKYVFLEKEGFETSDPDSTDATGDVTGDTSGDVTDDTSGDVTGDTSGDTSGDVTGDTTGDVTGDTTGNDETEEVTDDTTGDTTGGDAANETTSSDEVKLSEEQILPVAVRIFNESHVVHLLWFIMIYLLVYVFFGEFIKRSGDTSPGTTMSRIFDYVVFFWAVGFTIFLYYTSSEDVKSNVIQALMDWTIEFYDDPLSIFSVTLFLISFYAVVMLLRVPMGEGSKPYSVELIESKSWVLIASLLICYFFKYALGINLMDIFRDPSISKFWKNTLDDKPVGEEESTDVAAEESTDTITGNTEDATLDNTETTAPKEEVFNVANHNLSYRDAQAVCKSYNARLATYDEVEQSYMDGAEWCNYGWSENQMAFFPTQKATWEELQKQPTMKNRCGRPGVNGGYIPNGNMKFGANCYGVKPGATEDELNQMSTKFESNVPKTKEELMLEEKANYWKENQDKLTLSSFNRKKWSFF